MSDPDLTEVDPNPAGAARSSRVDLSFEVEPGTRLRVTVETLDQAGECLGRQAYLFHPDDGAPSIQTQVIPAPGGSRSWAAQVRIWLQRKALTLDTVLLGLAVLLYLSTRFIGLTSFPIYFFTDEAIQTVQASDLVAHNFASATQEILPTYFVNGEQYNLSVSVYLQVIPYLLFGKSIWVTRGVAVLVTAFGALALGLILRDIFKIRHGGWTGVLLLSVAPAWFLHSRTAFETTLGVSFYVAFLCFYLRYRTISPRYLTAALILGGLAFYSYSPMQIVVAATGLLLLASDWRYHWQNRRTALKALGVLVLLALPYVRFLSDHPGANADHLRLLDSYWIKPVPLAEKLGTYFSHYVSGLNPAYWYLPNQVDLPRHLMKGYGHILIWMFPFAALGLVIALRNIRSASHRVILVALLVAPSGAALADIGITRLLVFLVPATLLAGLGLAAAWDGLQWRRLPYGVIAVGVFALLLVTNLSMLSDALRNGPTWYSDYGLAGMQWGASQVFGAARQIVAQSPQRTVIISPAWANGTDVLQRFFVPDAETNISLGTIDEYMLERKPLDLNSLFVMLPDEYMHMLTSAKFKAIQVDQILHYPNGIPGFYFVRLQYADNFDAILAAEKAERRKLLVDTIAIQGQPVKVQYSRLDMGEVKNMFDGDLETLSRTLEANPMVVDLTFPQPTTLRQVSVMVGGPPTQVTARIRVVGQDQPVTVDQKVSQSAVKRHVTLDFGQTYSVTELHLEIFSVDDGEPAHVHVWEIQMK